jgi:hypothetical protein
VGPVKTGRFQATCTYISREPTVYFPSSEFGLPLFPTSVCAPPPPGDKGGWGAHSPAGEGIEGSQFRRLEKKLSSIPNLCLGLSNAGMS